MEKIILSLLFFLISLHGSNQNPSSKEIFLGLNQQNDDNQKEASSRSFLRNLDVPIVDKEPSPEKGPLWWQKYNPLSRHFRARILVTDSEWENKKKKHGILKKILFDYPRENPLVIIIVAETLLLVTKPVIRFGKASYHYIVDNYKKFPKYARSFFWQKSSLYSHYFLSLKSKVLHFF